MVDAATVPTGIFPAPRHSTSSQNSLGAAAVLDKVLSFQVFLCRYFPAPPTCLQNLQLAFLTAGEGPRPSPLNRMEKTKMKSRHPTSTASVSAPRAFYWILCSNFNVYIEAQKQQGQNVKFHLKIVPNNCMLIRVTYIICQSFVGVLMLSKYSYPMLRHLPIPEQETDGSQFQHVRESTFAQRTFCPNIGPDLEPLGIFKIPCEHSLNDALLTPPRNQATLMQKLRGHS